MLSSNRLVSAFKPWEPICNNGHSVGNAVDNGESGSVKCSTEGIATVLLNIKDPNPIEDTTSCIDEQTSIVTTSMKRTKMTSLGSNNKHLKPSKKQKTGITPDDPSISSVGKSKEIDKSRKGVELNSPLMNSSRKNGKLTGDDGEVEASPQGGTGDLTVETTPEFAEKGNGIKDMSPVVIGLQCKALTYSRIKKLQPDAPSAPQTTDNVEGKEGDTNSIPKRKRGRPRKKPLKSPEASLLVNHQNGGDDTIQGAGFVEGSKMNAGAGTEPGKENQEVDLDKLLNKSSGKASVQQKGKKVKGRRGKRRRTISSINIEASPQDANGGLEKEAAVGNSELPAEKSVDTVSDDQPLSRWFEGMQSATIVDSTVASKKPLENLDVLPNVDSGKLSFVKSSPLWETLESMEVFRTIPQKPHFRPLNSLKESAREGQAISQMVNFSKVVEDTSRLRFESPRTTIEECLEVLVELEGHGFDVKLIRDRLTGLLLIKDKQEELEGRWKEISDKIEQKNVDRKQNDVEIQLLDKKIRELLERRSQILSNKAKSGSEVGGLEAEVDGIKEGLNEIRRKFDCLAAASLCMP